MEYQGRIHLTNMCLIYDHQGNILVQDRKKEDWPGINLPGGHVEIKESLEESCIREMKEETGLDVYDLEKCGFFEWNIPGENTRHLAILYRTDKYKGDIVSSSEGDIFWINVRDLHQYRLSLDADRVIEECLKGINI